ncbi:MAG: hypothetical protein J6Q45_04255, partial [Alistipes sp.]|nr:hypothetical protein [Alistipes sp.]
MKTLLRYVIALYAILIGVGVSAQQIINITDFGATPNTREDCREAFAKAVEACGGKDATIVFPKGEYHFYQAAGEQRTRAMRLHRAKNITIEGSGSEFVFHGNMGIMMIEHCENITVRNLSTDWERTYISQGEFVEVADDHIDLRID